MPRPPRTLASLARAVSRNSRSSVREKRLAKTIRVDLPRELVERIERFVEQQNRLGVRCTVSSMVERWTDDGLLSEGC